MESNKDMQVAIMQMAIVTTTVMVRAWREGELAAIPNTRGSILEEQCRPKQAMPMLIEPMFD